MADDYDLNHKFYVMWPWDLRRILHIIFCNLSVDGSIVFLFAPFKSIMKVKLSTS